MSGYILKYSESKPYSFSRFICKSLEEVKFKLEEIADPYILCCSHRKAQLTVIHESRMIKFDLLPYITLDVIYRNDRFTVRFSPDNTCIYQSETLHTDEMEDIIRIHSALEPLQAKTHLDINGLPEIQILDYLSSENLLEKLL
jgi:hypothetical protein